MDVIDQQEKCFEKGRCFSRTTSIVGSSIVASAQCPHTIGLLPVITPSIKCSRHCCWQTTWNGIVTSDDVCSIPHSCLTMLSESACSHPGLRRLLMDLIFRLCSVLWVSWSAETVTRCWQWPQWINNVVKTTMITAAFIILSTPKEISCWTPLKVSELTDRNSEVYWIYVT